MFRVATAGIMRGVVFLRHTKRKKDGKEHRYWSIVENRRVGGGRVVQRAAAVPGRDQRFAGTGLAQVDRRPRGRSGGAAPPVAVPGRPLRGGAARRRGRPAEACRAAVVPAAAVGRVLAGGEPVARTGARPVLGRAARPEPQGDALAPGAVALGDLPAAGAG